ncbi:sushi, nidogen and EGF-like domain-containing protein [Pimephales promelas]|nr:sushi, nidogen and EGF-like domain-containing protein [Pimephales promelas]
MSFLVSFEQTQYETLRITPTKTTTVLPATTTTTTTATTTVSTTIPTTTPWTAPAIFYPFGAAAGDTEQIEMGTESYIYVPFSKPFMFFGRKYNDAYVNNNGLLSFSQPLPEAHPYQFPAYGIEDFIAPFWTELDDIGYGRYWYQEYTDGSVLTRATQDINQHFPHKTFFASWVFVATWDYVHAFDLNVLNLHSAPAITFQLVLISGGDFSFILMNYGDCAGSYFPVEAGFDTINSTDYHVIHYDVFGNLPNLKNMSNVNVPGRWAFLVNNGTENVIGVQLKLSSFLDLTQPGKAEYVLQQFKQELVNRGVSNFFEMKLRKVEKTP